MEITKQELIELLDAYILYCNVRKKCFNNKPRKGRNPNFPEDISENIIRVFIENREKKDCTWVVKSGDLLRDGDTKIEVKCSSSKGPSSFGPTESWDELYFLDATDFNNKIFTIYHIPYSNKSTIFSNHNLSKKETYQQSCKKGKRPRFHMKEFIKKNHIKPAYIGTIDNI